MNYKEGDKKNKKHFWCISIDGAMVSSLEKGMVFVFITKKEAEEFNKLILEKGKVVKCNLSLV